jgi:hypothetical protein
MKSQNSKFVVGTKENFGPQKPRSTALGYELNDRGFQSRQRLGIFLFITVSRPVLGLTRPPVQ